MSTEEEKHANTPDELAGLRDLVGRFRDRANELTAGMSNNDDEYAENVATESRADGLRDAAAIIEAWGRDMAAADANPARDKPDAIKAENAALRTKLAAAERERDAAKVRHSDGVTAVQRYYADKIAELEARVAAADKAASR